MNIIPNRVKIRSRVQEQEQYVDTGSEVWKWRDGGILTKIDWNNFSFCNTLKNTLKNFIIYRLQTRSLMAIGSNDKWLLQDIDNSSLRDFTFWTVPNLIEFLGVLSSRGKLKNIHTFRSFYRWATSRNIDGFLKETLITLMEFKAPIRKPYANVFLAGEYLSSEDEDLILYTVKNNYDQNNFISLRDNTILSLCFELSPRPIQIHSIDINDFQKISGSNNNSYYSIMLPLAKKLSNTNYEKRNRKISTELGKKIESLIQFNMKIFNDDVPALFRDTHNKNDDLKRLSTVRISKIIQQQLKESGLDKGQGATVLRHHLAQSLADQGASAEVIAEILGHNSTLPSNAYIAATPEIAAIKTKALGKNTTYKDISKMLLTGKIIDRNKFIKERWVKGMVGAQYIGGIGSCGLPENTSCPKNPVYSCYTCNKFHPFKDGSHEEVKIGLQKQVQFFIDTAENGLDIEHNRPMLQLEQTIKAVDKVMDYIKITH